MIEILGDCVPSTPDHLVETLRMYDKSLSVHWNTRRRFWVIEACAEHHSKKFDLSGHPVHTEICKKYFVTHFDVDDISRDRVLGKLKSIDTTEKYGTGERGLENFKLADRQTEEAMADKRSRDMKDIGEHNAKDHRVQLNKARHLIQQHDMGRMNK